jgi:hypothetical protein
VAAFSRSTSVGKEIAVDQANQVTSCRARHGITGTLALAMLLASLGTSIANIALPTLTVAFDASFSH